jgi:uncharacterized Tic20 family protein
MIHFKCVKCGDLISVEDSCAGQAVTCPKCGNVGVAPSVSQAAGVGDWVQPPAPPAAKDTEKQVRMWGMLCHLAALSLLVGIPFGHIIGPLVVWLLKKDEDPFIDEQGKESLNFQISMTIYGAVCSLLVLVLVGILLLVALVILELVMVITASVRANEGKSFRYPLTIRFLK